MHVEVFSIMAACIGRYPTMWRGDVDLKLVHKPSEDTLPNLIYRHFNRVEHADDERLKEIGYDLPSLSVGDFFTVKGVTFWPEAQTYRVETLGFTKITNNPKAIMEAFQ